MDMPKLAILDGDLMAYKAACFADKEGIDELEARINFDVKLWTPSGVDKVLLAFSPKRSNNYRRDFWPAYKAHRDGKPGPEALPATIEMMKDSFDIIERPRIEADDIMGMAMSSGTAVAVTLDKDLRSCPGWLWNPEKQGFPELISLEEADKWFHTQWLTGDNTDRIPGIHRLGVKGAEKMLNATPREEWDQMIIDHYLATADDRVKWTVKGEKFEGTRQEMISQQYGWESGQDLEYCLAQARCVRILRAGEWDKTSETHILWAPNCLQKG